MERKHLRVLVSMFWSGSSTSHLYKTSKDSHCNFDADLNQNNHLSVRHAVNEPDYKWSRNSLGYIDFLLQGLGFVINM